MRKGRVLTESKILEKIFKFAQQSSRPGKSTPVRLQRIVKKALFLWFFLKVN